MVTASLATVLPVYHRALPFHVDGGVTFCLLLSSCISEVPFSLFLCDFSLAPIIRQQTVVRLRVARGGIGWLGPRRKSRHHIHQFTNKTAQRVARVPESLTNSDRRSSSSSSSQSEGNNGMRPCDTVQRQRWDWQHRSSRCTARVYFTFKEGRG